MCFHHSSWCGSLQDRVEAVEIIIELLQCCTADLSAQDLPPPPAPSEDTDSVQDRGVEGGEAALDSNPSLHLLGVALRQGARSLFDEIRENMERSLSSGDVGASAVGASAAKVFTTNQAV